jgi:hypothetical protein
MKTFLFELSGPTLFLGLLISMVLCLFVGNFIASKQAAKEKFPTNADRLIGALFALTAFILGFSFSMSSNRYDMRRQAMVDEANSIGTAVLRADLYPDSMRNLLRSAFQEYLEARIRFHEVGANYDSAIYYNQESGTIGLKIWSVVTNYSRQTQNLVTTSQMIPAVNAMLDASTTRYASLIAKVPEPVLYMLFFLVLMSAFFAGYTRKNEGMDKLVSFAFCVLTVAVVYLVIDLDRERRGLITMDATHQTITDLRGLFRR